MRMIHGGNNWGESRTAGGRWDDDLMRGEGRSKEDRGFTANTKTYISYTAKNTNVVRRPAAL
jgi:hypothetical protein